MSSWAERQLMSSFGRRLLCGVPKGGALKRSSPIPKLDAAGIEIHGRRRLRFKLGHLNSQRWIISNAHTKTVAYFETTTRVAIWRGAMPRASSCRSHRRGG